jgi:hypothetical protein
MPYTFPVPPWYLHVPGVKYGSQYILEPRFSQSVLRAQLNEHAMLDSLTTGYECAVAAAALGVYPEDLPSALANGETLINSSGNLLGRKHEFDAIVSTSYGAICAVENNETECGMSKDCVIALEGHYLDLQFDDNHYERSVCEEYIYEVLDDWPDETGDWLVKTFGAIKSDPYISNYEEIFEVNINEGVCEIDDIVGWHVDLLSLPINAQAATHYGHLIDPRRFVEELEVVDISTISAKDMECMHCWSSFDEAGDDIIELTNGNVQADNSPVKMPCPHGHLIGKTCLMQLIDAEIRLCPLCRFEIVPASGDPRGPLGAVFSPSPPEQYSVWD